MAKRRISVEPGTLFLVPRKDGKYVLGQVLEEWMVGAICIAVFDHVLEAVDEEFVIEGAPSVLSLPSVSKTEISKGHWPSIGRCDVLVDVRMAPHYEFKDSKFVGASWHSGVMIEDLVNAYYGLVTWEPYPGRPGQLRSLLLASSHGSLLKQ